MLSNFCLKTFVHIERNRHTEMGKATLQYNGQIEVRLSQEEQQEAAQVASLRHRSHRKTGRPDFKSRPQDDGKKLDLYGALAEKAVAVAVGRPWDGSFKPMSEWDIWRRDGHDVSGLEVKSIRISGRCLILHDHSKPELPAVLVHIVSRDRYYLVGWCFTRDGQKEEYQLGDGDIPRGCYMVPQSDLRPMAELFALIGVNVPEKEPEITGEDLGRLLDKAS